MTSMWRPRYFAVVSRHEKVPTAPHMSAMPMSPARRALAASRACTADSVFMGVAACGGKSSLPRGKANAVHSGKLRANEIAHFERMAAMPWACAVRLPLARERAFVPPAQQKMGDERQCEEDRYSGD